MLIRRRGPGDGFSHPVSVGAKDREVGRRNSERWKKAFKFLADFLKDFGNSASSGGFFLDTVVPVDVEWRSLVWEFIEEPILNMILESAPD